MSVRRDLPPGADVGGLYRALGVHLPQRGPHEATVPCFANPNAHRREDRSPSCSVSLVSGAWCCHACGAAGGAYDAALTRGLSPRAAMDLLIAHGLAERRQQRSHQGRDPSARAPVTPPPPPVPAASRLTIPDAQITRWAHQLRRQEDLARRLARARAWDPRVTARLQIGWDGRRVTIPVRDPAGRLVALLRYDPDPLRRGPKMLAAPGSRRALFPPPAAVSGDPLWLVEGHPDAIAALSARLPAVAVPGVLAWDPTWAGQFGGRRVIVCFDCDPHGRAAAQRVAEDLRATAAAVFVLDLAPERADGFDLTDVLLAGGLAGLAGLIATTALGGRNAAT
jgi:hypothetical protein